MNRAGSINAEKELQRFNLLWRIGTALAFVLYYSGFLFLFDAARRTFGKKTRHLVLTYHRVRDDMVDTHIAVTARSFERQLAYLRSKFKILPLSTLVGVIDGKASINADSVALTFDDGYEDNYNNAFPILKKFESAACIFLVSSLIGKSGYLSLEQINLMRSSGMEFGSHTVNHRILTEVTSQERKFEIMQSKVVLEKLLKHKISFLAYPSGKIWHYDLSAKTIAKEAGYRAAFSTINGGLKPGNDPYELNRIGIRECPLFVFKVRLSGIFETRLMTSVRNYLQIR